MPTITSTAITKTGRKLPSKHQAPRPGSEFRAKTRVPSLDGLRAVSIGFVLISHSFTQYAKTHDQDWLYAVRLLGALGVTVFFGISGFIITSLLESERARMGQISLREFYVRRAFRILPPFWIYVGVVVALGPPLPDGAVRNALLFISNYLPTGWWLGHSWSLSVEEQFYLLWPATVALAFSRSSRIALAVVLLAPFVRIAHHLAEPARSLDAMFHTRADALAVGCLVALERERLTGGRLGRIVNRGSVALGAAAFLTVASPLLERRFHGLYTFPLRFSLEALGVGTILLWAISHPDSRAGRVLNCRLMVAFGSISYSLYLWQQAFFSDELATSKWGQFPLNIAGPLALATISFHLVERPFQRLRDRVMHRMRGVLAPESGQAGATPQ